MNPADKRGRGAKFPKEKPDTHTAFIGPLGMAGMEEPLEQVLEKLERPVAADANVELTVAALETERLRLQKEAKLVMETWLAFDRDLREYNAANGITEGFTPVVNPHRRAELRDRGKDLNVEMDKAAESSTVKSVSRKSGTGRPFTTLLPRT